MSIGININKFGKDLLTGCIQKNSPESAEFVVPFFPNPIPEDLGTTEFQEFASKYAIVYQGSNYFPMEEEYKKRKEIRAIMKKEI